MKTGSNKGLRDWANAIAVAGIILGAGFAIATAGWKPYEWPFWAILAGFTPLALLAVILLRPASEERDTEEERVTDRLPELRTKVNVRDIAILSTAMKYQLYPKFVSDRACSLAPPGEKWEPEDESQAIERARRLIDLGLLQWRSNEIETTELGRQLVRFDEDERRSAAAGR